VIDLISIFANFVYLPSSSVWDEVDSSSVWDEVDEEDEDDDEVGAAAAAGEGVNVE
jgi:hypothetical protein